MKTKATSLPKRNYLVALVMTKKGAGKHRDKKREFKNSHKE
jgi:hypothetical protein